MGCTANKSGDTRQPHSGCFVGDDDKLLERPDEEIYIENEKNTEQGKVQETQKRKVEWTPEAEQWRMRLRTTQSLIAAFLYVVSTWIRNAPHHWVSTHLLLALLLAAPFTLVYHFLSWNRAGSYYDGYVEMFTKFPQHFLESTKKGSFCPVPPDFKEIGHERENGNVRNVDGSQTQEHFRDRKNGGSLDFMKEIEQELEQGIVRTVDALQTGLLFLIVSWLSALLSWLWPSSAAGIASDYFGRCAQTAAFFVLHRVCGANLFPGQFYGMIRPAARWRFRCEQSAANADWKMTPLCPSS